MSRYSNIEILITYIVDLSGGSTTNGVGNAHTVHANLVHCPVKGEEVDEVGPERVLAGDYQMLDFCIEQRHGLKDRQICKAPGPGRQASVWVWQRNHDVVA